MRRFLSAAIPVLTLLVIFSASPVSAEPSVFSSIGLEARKMNGETINNISFDNPFASGGHGASRLEFPIDNYFYGINIELGSIEDYNPGRKVHTFGLTWLQAVEDDAGTMRDSDWVENDVAICGALCGGNTPGRDLYTQSDDELTSGRYLDLSYRYNHWLGKNVAVGPVLGYRYFQLKHDVIGCTGSYWGTPVTCPPVKGIAYEVEHEYPYVGVNTEVVLGREEQGAMRVMLAYAPYVTANYTDIHLYPAWDAANPGFNYDREFHGDLDGDALELKLEGSWRFNPRWMVSLGGEYTTINTDGSEKQKAFMNGVPISVAGGVDADVETTVWSTLLKVTYLHY